MHDKLIILAGGASSRMKKPVETNQTNLSEEEIKQANERSKGLIGVGGSGRPLLDYVLFNAKKAGYKKIYIIIGPNGDLFKEYYGSKDKDNDFHGMNISFAVQHIPEDRVKPFGTADALFQASEQYPELQQSVYSVCNSDNLYSEEVFSTIRTSDAAHAFPSYDRSKLEFPPERVHRFSLVTFNEEGFLTDFIEKPSAEQVEQYKTEDGTFRVSMNIFKFDGATLFPFLRDCPVHPERNEKELPTALLNMVKQGGAKILGIPFAEHVPDLTAKDDIADMKEYLKKHYPDQLDWNF